MELIQNSVKRREGRKWKQRWAVLRKDVLQSHQEVYYYLFFYKDAAHAKEGKEKNTLPLSDFCGLDFCRLYDKEENILVLVTCSQTVYLSFDSLSVSDHWKQTLIEHLGEAMTYKICIPDKQKLKAGDATIRLYSSFVSIITSNNYKCLNRWYLNDIDSYCAVDNKHFMFAITSSSKTKRGNVINLLVKNDNADEIYKAFESLVPEPRTLVRQRHDSAMLDELDQARRNVGDQNFFRRAILRASERMRKKKRGRSHNVKKNAGNNSKQEQEKFCSLDRKKHQQISNDFDNDTILRIVSQTSSNIGISPDLSQKKSKHLNKIHSLPNAISPDPVFSPDNLDKVDSVSTGSKIETDTIFFSDVSNSDKDLDEIDGNEKHLHTINFSAAIDNARNPPSSVDNICIFNYKNPARYAIEKTKRSNSKSKSEKTPTPPPRSPVSLGLDPCSVFQFPPDVDESESFASSVGKDEDTCNYSPTYPELNLNNNIKEVQNTSQLQNNNTGTKSKISQDVIVNNDLHSVSHADISLRRNHQQNVSDPLDVEQWAKATGDGKFSSSPVESPLHPDYVNISETTQGALSDDENSYVNMPLCNANHTDIKLKLLDPKSPNLKSPRNDFEKYDDDDSSIYHPVCALDDASYKNFNARNFIYANVNNKQHLSPVSSTTLNYIHLGLAEKKTNNTSPMQTPPAYSCDYTLINVDATEAIQRSMEEHRQHRDSASNKTPTRISR